ncbi:hypothetical protein [Paenibacillus sp. CECT 9249]|nr:hypothetical protein [Paenibacillus sp. CECT 9249]
MKECVDDGLFAYENKTFHIPNMEKFQEYAQAFIDLIQYRS